MKDYGRKNYSDHQYRDWMRTTTSKEIANTIIVKNIGLGEFSNNKANKTSLDRAIAHFLRQSRMKKPYRSGLDFKDMEETWEGPSGGFNMPSITWPRFDQPWNMQTYETTSPWSIIFDLISTSKYCAGETTPWTIRGTHPIYHIGLSFEYPGTTIEVLGGYGTNVVTGTITADSDEWHSIDFNGSMTAFVGADRPGVTGSSNYLMPGSRDCCDPADPVLPDDDSNPTTMAHDTSASIYVLGGAPPFDWSVAGATGFTLDQATTTVRQNTLIAASGACGSPIVTVTDKCLTEAEIVVRCTNNSHWHSVGVGCWNSGPATSCVLFTAKRVSGKYRQTDKYFNTYCWHGTCPGCVGPRPYQGSPCIDFDCSCIMTGYSAVNCYDPYTRKCRRPTIAVDDIYSINSSGEDWRCN